MKFFINQHNQIGSLRNSKIKQIRKGSCINECRILNYQSNKEYLELIIKPNYYNIFYNK